MIHTGEVPGKFATDEKKSEIKCRKCGSSNNVYEQLWESSCGGYEDLFFHCRSCHKSWWVEGPDS